MADSRPAPWGEHAGSVRGLQDTCRHNAGEKRRGPELEGGREIAGSSENRVTTPIFSIKYSAYKSQSAFFKAFFA